MGACVSHPGCNEEVGPSQATDDEEQGISRMHTGSLSAFAPLAAQVYSEPDSPPPLSLQPSQMRMSQTQQSHGAVQALSAPMHTLHQECGRMATAPQIEAALARISPWAAMDVTTNASTINAPALLTLAAAAHQRPESPPRGAPSKEEHRAQLVQLLDDACRDQCVDWKALRGSLLKASSADAPDMDNPLPAQALMHDTSSASFLQMASSERHDSASSSIEPRRPPVPASPRTPRVPVLGRMGTAGSLPVYSYAKPAPEPSCPDFLRMLSAEGRSAYAQWRGEEDSCRLEDLNSACDAAISSLGTISCGSWLEIDMNSRNQSLFFGEDNDVKSPFENKIPTHIQRSLSSPNNLQPAAAQPCKTRSHRPKASRRRSLDHLTVRVHQGRSLPASRHRNSHLQVVDGRDQSFQSNFSFSQSPKDGRLMKAPRPGPAGSGLSSRPPLPRQASAC